MKKVYFLLTFVIFIIVFIGCAKDSASDVIAEDHAQPQADQIKKPSATETVFPDNPNGEWIYQLKSIMIESDIQGAVFGSRLLIGCPFPGNYEELVSSGLLTIKYNNRYTGAPINITKEYSPGDFYYSTDLESGQWTFYLHMGEKDVVYEPAITEGKDVAYAGDPSIAVTNGSTIKYAFEVPLETIEMIPDTASFRERFGIPPSDDARVKVYLVSKYMDNLMYGTGEMMETLPESLDGYVSFLGEKNPVAWTNPYSGGQMHEVGWYDVPLYYKWEPLSEPIENLNAGTSNLPSDLAGNYSYITVPSPHLEGAMRSYAKFYFLEPDGSVAAYIAIGVDKKEYEAGALKIG